jgi:hypothetical protein
MKVNNSAASPRAMLIRKYFTPSQLGAEIGPFHSPICPKHEGYNCLVVDAFSRDQLLVNYSNDPYVMERKDCIEEVDIVSTQPLGEALTTYAQQSFAKISSADACIDYIVSSHNFEHQPNPIRFLQDAEKAIQPGGYLVMAIPIASRCFDCFQPLSRTGEFIDAYYQQKTKPSIGNIFDHQASSAKLIDDQSINDATYDFNQIKVNGLRDGCIDESAYTSMKQTAENSYVDSHCWRYNPHQFELVFSDLKACGFINYLSILEIITNGSEFIVYIERSGHISNKQPLSAEKRTELMKNSLVFQFKDLLQNVDTKENQQLSDSPKSPQNLNKQTSWSAKAKSIIKILMNRQ